MPCGRQPVRGIRLERDLEYAIAEYAPGSEIVANGKVLLSGGIDLQNRELEVRGYQNLSGLQPGSSRSRAIRYTPSVSYVRRTASGPRSR